MCTAVTSCVLSCCSHKPYEPYKQKESNKDLLVMIKRLRVQFEHDTAMLQHRITKLENKLKSLAE